jgi:hypothetical protein
MVGFRPSLVNALLADTPAVSPKHVAIVGLGPSMHEYVKMAKGLGSRAKLCDEVWGINALGDVLNCDRVFHMDDVAVQALRACAQPDSNIAAMLVWLQQHPGPIYTSIVREGYPGMIPFPLEDVINDLGYGYFNNTCAYAVALAIHIGVEKISMFGCDFTYPKAHDAEKGRGCVEYWLGFARARGIEILLPATTSLMDSCEPEALKLYGYDAVKVDIEEGEDDRVTVKMTPRDALPSAEEIEARYDHSTHPNPLMPKPTAA